MYVAMDGSMMVAIHSLVSKYVLSGYLEPFGYSGSCPRNQGAVNVFAAAVWWCYSRWPEPCGSHAWAAGTINKK